MAAFSYRGRNPDGKLVSGQLEADNTDAAAMHLTHRNIIPLEISPIKAANNVLHNLYEQLTTQKVSLLDLIFFSRQMYTLMRSGIPILTALRDLGQSTPNKVMQKAIEDINITLTNGQELSTALRQHPLIFPPLFASIVEVGESSGNLDQSFQMLATYLEKERELNNNIRSALRYPLIVIAVIAIAIVIINIFVIPAFAGVFNSFHAELPLMTRILIGFSDFMLAYWQLLLGLVVALIFGLKSYIKTVGGRLLWHKYKLKLPLVGDIIFRSIMGRFSHTLALCIKAGIPWSKTFTIVSKTTDNDVVARHVLQIRDSIEQGVSIAQAATECGLFPPLVLQMIHVGEQTGSLDKLLTEIAEFYEREVAYQVKTLNDALEPLLLTLVSVIVLILALGVFLPMWDLSKAALG
jgi:MSHA biogenesis protein MshG